MNKSPGIKSPGSESPSAVKICIGIFGRYLTKSVIVVGTTDHSSEVRPWSPICCKMFSRDMYWKCIGNVLEICIGKFGRYLTQTAIVVGTTDHSSTVRPWIPIWCKMFSRDSTHVIIDYYPLYSIDEQTAVHQK